MNYFITILTTVLLISVGSTSFSEDNRNFQIQEYLNYLGYNVGAVDGIIGKRTKSQLNKFLQDYGFSAEGNNLDEQFRALQKILETKGHTVSSILPKTFDLSPLCSGYDNEVVANSPTSEEISNIENIIHDWRYVEDNVNRSIFNLTSAVLLAPENSQTADTLVNYLHDIGNSNFATQLSSDAEENLVFTDFLLHYAHAILALSELNLIDQTQKLKLVGMLKSRISLPSYKQKHYYDMRSCTTNKQGEKSSDLGGCQNHTYGVQHLRMLTGHLANDKQEYQRGIKLYKFAIDDLGRSGALWREASRGAYSWGYYAHALGHLVAIASIDKALGGQVFDYNNAAGNSIHTAIEFYIGALNNQNVMHIYSDTNWGVEGRKLSSKPRSLEYYRRVTSDKFYHEWFPVYRQAFPEHPNVSKFLSSVNFEQNLPRHTSRSKHLGLNTWCIYSNETNEATDRVELYWITELKDDGYESVVEAKDILTAHNSRELKVKTYDISDDSVGLRDKLKYSIDGEVLKIRGDVLLFGNERVSINVIVPLTLGRKVIRFGHGDKLILKWSVHS